jgi:hypothetical protein
MSPFMALALELLFESHERLPRRLPTDENLAIAQRFDKLQLAILAKIKLLSVFQARRAPEVIVPGAEALRPMTSN